MERNFRYYAAVTAVALLTGMAAAWSFGAEAHSVMVLKVVSIAVVVAYFSMSLVAGTTKKDFANISMASLLALMPVGLFLGDIEGAFVAVATLVVAAVFCLVVIIGLEPGKFLSRLIGCQIIELVTIAVGLGYLSSPWVTVLTAVVGIFAMGAVSFLPLPRERAATQSAA